MKSSGSITTAYAFSSDLHDSKSDMFKEYSSTIEKELSSIVMRSSVIDSVNLEVTGFKANSPKINRRRVQDAKAVAEFEAVTEVSKNANIEDIQAAMATQIKSASDKGLKSLDVDSFQTLELVVVTFKTTSTALFNATKISTASRTETSKPTTHDSIVSNQSSSLLTCPKGNEWFNIDQSKSLPWSWQVNVFIEQSPNAGLKTCSGVILSPEWILTAAAHKSKH